MVRELNSKDRYQQYVESLVALQNRNPVVMENRTSDKNIDMQISPLEGQILHTLLSINKSKNVVEIGTLYGYSTSWIAEAIPEDGLVYSIEKNPDRAKIAINNLYNLRKKVQIIIGDATEELFKLPKKSYDAIFIDGKKREYGKYLDWAENNLRKGGLIVADNVLLFGRVYKQGAPDNIEKRVMTEFNERLSDPNLYRSVLIPTKDGLFLAQKEF